MVAAGREEALQEGGALRTADQLRAGQGPFGVVRVEVEAGTEIGGAVQGPVAGEENGVRVLVAVLGQERAQLARLGEDVQLTGVVPDPGEEEQGAGVLDPDAGQ